jgi:putative spermidine/putrescine transport system permease protein
VIQTLASIAASEAGTRPQDTVVRRRTKQRRDWTKIGLGTYFAVFLFFLYIPTILMAILSFQGSNGNLTFPFEGPAGFGWWRSLWDSSLIGYGQNADAIRAATFQSLRLSLAAGGIVAVLGFMLSMAFRRRWRFRTDSVAFYAIMLALMTPAFLVGLGNQLLWKAMSVTPSFWHTALGANVVWGIPFAFLVMLAVWNRYDKRIEEAARDLGADQKRTFWEVTLPLVWTGIFGSFLFGFTLMWNDYDRTVLLNNGYDTLTLPLQIGGMTFSQAIRPDLYALGTATTAISLLAIGLLLLVVWLRLKFRGAPVQQQVAEEFGDTTGLGRAGVLAAGDRPAQDK